MDGLHTLMETECYYENRLVEAHGRLGFYKCIPVGSNDDEEVGEKAKLGM